MSVLGTRSDVRGRPTVHAQQRGTDSALDLRCKGTPTNLFSRRTMLLMRIPGGATSANVSRQHAPRVAPKGVSQPHLPGSRHRLVLTRSKAQNYQGGWEVQRHLVNVTTSAMNDDVSIYRSYHWESYLSKLCISERNVMEKAKARENEE